MIQQRNVINLAAVRRDCSGCLRTQQCLCAQLAEQNIDHFSSVIKRIRLLARGDEIFGLSSPFHMLYAVRSGSVKVYTLTDQGEEQVLGFYLPGDVLGLSGVVNQVHGCIAVALETTSVCELPFERIEELGRSYPGVQNQLHRFYAEEINRARDLLLFMSKRTAEQRLSHFLLTLSKRLAKRGFSAHEFNLSMARQDIGCYLGLAVETVSRLFLSLQEKGVISVDRRNVRILDMEKLRRSTGESTNTPTQLLCS
ncbi:MAG: fumarate/nitrate reduction transcriptional regulator Fnr [Gammaproteobacteria bacterium]